MALSDEERRRIYEEERVREEARDEIQQKAKKRKQAQGCLGCIGLAGIIAVIVLVVGIVGFLDEDIDSTPETTPVPEGALLDFVTLREWEIAAGGIGAEILVPLGSSEEDVMTLGRFLRDVAWTDGFLNIMIYDNTEAWEFGFKCDDEYTGAPVDKFKEIESGAICTKARELRARHILANVGRNPSTGHSSVTWNDPER